jgi:hypothetical protein
VKSVVVGAFNVEFDVVDQHGISLPTIDAYTPKAYNLVRITNTGPLPKAVEVEVILPNGKRSLEFMIAGSAHASWSDATPLIAAVSGTASCDRTIERNSGMKRKNEPIQFQRLSQRPAHSLSFFRVRDPAVPFQIAVDAG